PPSPPPPEPAPTLPGSVSGRMTGGGNFRAADGTAVSHEFELRCNASDPRQNLDITWGEGNKFQLDGISAATCYNDPAIHAKKPNSAINTLVLSGAGTYNGQSGTTIQLLFSDAGEPGRNDRVQMMIKDVGNNVILNVPPTTLMNGNHQAH